MIQRPIVRSALALLLNVLLVASVAAQESPFSRAELGQQSLRPYWHVFIAYTIAIVMIGGWAISIARRLRKIEERLGD